jgi:hypothetical protein
LGWANEENKVLSVRLLLLLCLLLPGLVPAADKTAAEVQAGVPLVINQRTIHVFRGPLGMFSAEERVEGARRRIEPLLELPGEGWTSARSTPQGVLVELDGKPLFLVLPSDANTLAGETPEALANRATRVLNRVWSEAHELRDTHASLDAALRVGVATLLLILGLVLGGRV